MKSSRGFTLIELLISMAILFVLLALSMFGYQLFTSQWQKNNQRAELAYQQLRHYELFSNAMHGIVPYVVKSDNSTGFYFLGREEGFTAITQTPIFNTSAPAVIRVFRETKDSGGFQLVYEEASLKEQPLVSAEQSLPFSHRLVLIPQLDSITFRYYRRVLSDIELNDQGDTVKKFEWVFAHDGLETKKHPHQLEVNLAGFSWFFSIPDRHAIMKSRYTNKAEVD